MDVLVMLMLVAVVGYALIRVLAFVIPRDREQWKKERGRREALRPKEMKRVNQAFEDIAKMLRPKKSDD